MKVICKHCGKEYDCTGTYDEVPSFEYWYFCCAVCGKFTRKVKMINSNPLKDFPEHLVKLKEDCMQAELESLHNPGAKDDATKIRAGLVLGAFSRALEQVCRVGTFGAKKYSDNGWTQVSDGINRYTDALYRHLLTEAKGEQDDPESGIRHAAHAAWNAIARLELMLREESDNIPVTTPLVK